jgi:hypothetical protein
MEIDPIWGGAHAAGAGTSSPSWANGMFATRCETGSMWSASPVGHVPELRLGRDCILAAPERRGGGGVGPRPRALEV